MDSKVIWRRSGAGPVARGVFWAITLTCAIAAVVDGFVRSWADASVWLLLWVMIGGITLVTLWSMGRYTAIVVTPTELRVGRESVAAAEIDPAAIAASLASPEIGHAATRPIGGAFLVTLGSVPVRVGLRDGSQIHVGVPRPRPFLEALAEQQRRLTDEV